MIDQQVTKEDDTCNKEEEEEAIFEMDDIPRNISATSLSSSSSSNTMRQEMSIHDDGNDNATTVIRYYVPTQEEPQGLSQSVVLSEHDYLHRHMIMQYNSTRHHASSGNEMDTVTLHEDIDDDYYVVQRKQLLLSEELEIIPTNMKLYSQSAPPTDSFLSSSPITILHKNDSDDKDHLTTDSISTRSSSIEIVLPDTSQSPCTEVQSGHEATIVKELSIEDEWNQLADEHYGPLPILEHTKHQEQTQSTTEESIWDAIHRQPNVLDKIRLNPFIRELFRHYACPLKIMKIAKTTRFKELQHYIFDPNVLYMRYFRNPQCAYVIYRNYEEMLKGYNKIHLSVINGSQVECYPSTFYELEQNYANMLEKKSTVKYHDEDGSSSSHSHLNYTYTVDSNHRSKHSSTSLSKKSRQQKRQKEQYHKNDTFKCNQEESIAKNAITTKASTTVFFDLNTTTLPYYNYQGNLMKMMCSPFKSSSSPQNLLVTMLADKNQTLDDDDNDVNHSNAIVSPYLLLSTMPILPYQCVIVKLDDKADLMLCKEINYVHIPKSKVTFLNTIYEHSYQVILVFSVKGSKRFQGYAYMSSEILNINKLSAFDIQGTFFIEKLGLNQEIKRNNWKYICRIEWQSNGELSMDYVGDCINIWNMNKRLKYSKNITLVEPTLGKSLIDLMNDNQTLNK
ncbi:YT521-B-like domain-containing protein [Cokeromyces recurvatus]|uniref:YT521-B-like domain-containing protein n=1 Tax=Cokeromyces recurvatus TaxID=90255 RepID=UPI002220B73F|nr:YT521-B-like domain-containing protein [Cokeromyces recurvatus]KAI7898733.1 YT521-B-like domain-containing protein [Cokeromyces recurvatus]